MKNLLITILCFTGLGILSSCRKDVSPLIVGKWLEDSPCIEGKDCFLFEFKSDNTFIRFYPNYPQFLDTGKYSVQKSTININYQFTASDNGTAYEVKVVNAKKIILKKFYNKTMIPEDPAVYLDLHLSKIN